MYLLIKTLHLLFVMAWVASVFYLPRILVNIAEAGDELTVQNRLQLMGRRLYAFGNFMFCLMLLFGLALWEGWRIWPRQLPDVTSSTYWIDTKLGLVAVLLVYFMWVGHLLKLNTEGGALPSSKSLRWLNELPVILVVLTIYLVVDKPF
ncbi:MULTISPECIES: CopD family protein [Rhodanobacter]|uniref:CopD family protein n=1 Tax=Rhodanobacter TaxID=75309 RepID=UPI0005615853|nr:MULTISPECIES: CopD family protein [Rhodanobacter]TAN17314.1 MAG: CopD family protein [Rhodanobacter sp.]UJJ55721.1 CopD family protein [Rhodanobacter thiooxydans]